MWGLKKTELHNYGTDLTVLAHMGKLDHLTGRKEELEVLIEALMKTRNSNACLVGGAGVGKTAIVEALAFNIARNSVPHQLRGKKIFSIGMVGIVDGAMNRGEIEKRVQNVLYEVRESEGDVILVLDDIHDFIKEDGIAKILKFALARDEFKCIGTTNVDLEIGGAMEHMFEKIQVCEPSREDTIDILRKIIHKYEDHHRITYTRKALASAIDFSEQYIRGLLPGKAINLFDKAGARARVQGLSYVTEVEIKHVVSMSTGIVFPRVATPLLRLEDALKRKLVGQDQAVAAVCGSIRRARVEMRGETKPIACFLFVGPTGVGKTEMAKLLAEDYFGSEAAMVRLDTLKFMENCTVSRLVNQLVEEVRQRPRCVVLFDEVEKAHEEALNVVLRIINVGRLSDREGKPVDFRGTIVIVISNSESHSLKAEVINGFDRFVVFKPLEKEHIEKILEIAIEEFSKRVMARDKVRVEMSRRLKEWLLMVGYNKRYGAWTLKRTFADSVECKLADEILFGRVAEGDTIKLDVTLVGDVESHISRLQVDQKAQCSNPTFRRVDPELFRNQLRRTLKKDNQQAQYSNLTFRRVDPELIRIEFGHTLKKDRGLWIYGYMPVLF